MAFVKRYINGCVEPAMSPCIASQQPPRLITAAPLE